MIPYKSRFSIRITNHLQWTVHASQWSLAAQISRTACGRTAWTLQHRFPIPICIRIYTGYFRYRTGHSRDACSRRGSQGVVRRDTSADFIKTRDLLLSAGIYGNTLMAPIICSILTPNPIWPVLHGRTAWIKTAWPWFPLPHRAGRISTCCTKCRKAAGSDNYYM